MELWQKDPTGRTGKALELADLARPTNRSLGDADDVDTKKARASEAMLVVCALTSLVISCIRWSAHKQAWMDEIFTWREVSDPSLWHLYGAIQHGADGGMPLFYTTAWLWAKAFGEGVLTLRLYSCIAICGAMLITWGAMRRFYGARSTAIGVLAFWGTSGLLLDQNSEARFYGLFLLSAALVIDIHTRLILEQAPSRRLMVCSLIAQAALVLSHVLGIIYGVLILLALILSDTTKRRFRTRIYLFQSAGWLALLTWIPAIRSSMAAGRPKGWIMLPDIPTLFSAYLFEDCQQWLWFIQRYYSHRPLEQLRHSIELCMLVPLALVILQGLRRIALWKPAVTGDPRTSVMLLAYSLLLAPLILFGLSYVIQPVFVHRYLLPSGIGLAIILTDLADRTGADQGRLVLIWTIAAIFLAVFPVLSAFAQPPLGLSTQYLDVRRIDALAPQIAIVAGWQEDFSKLMRFSSDPQNKYFLLDWKTAVNGPTGFVLDYHLMQAYRDSGYYSNNIQEKRVFLCSHPDFLVLDTEGRSWFEIAIKNTQQFQWKVVDSFNTSDLPRRVISVHRRAPLPFCDHSGY